MNLSTDPIFKEVCDILAKHYHVVLNIIPEYRNNFAPSSSSYEFYQYVFTFHTHRGKIQVMYPSENIQRAIDRTLGRSASTTNPSYPSETNILDWISNEYLFLKVTKYQKSKASDFTDGYKHYDPNEGRGSKHEWKSTFGGAADFASEEEQERFEKQFKERKTSGAGFDDWDRNWEEFFNDFFNKGNQKSQQKQSTGFKPNSSSGTSPHAILGLDPLKKTTADELKKAYRQKCLEWHPDRNQHRLVEAESMMKKINEANEILKSAYGYK